MIDSLEVFEKTIRDKRTYRRFLCVWLKEAEGKSLAEIAEQTGYHERHVQRIQQQVRLHGVDTLRPAYKGGGRRLLSEAKESAIWAVLEGVTTIQVIVDAVSEAVGRPVMAPTIYAMLKRRGWRAKRPRPRHPQADVEAQTFFKNAARAD